MQYARPKKWRYAVRKVKIGRYAVRKAGGGVTLKYTHDHCIQDGMLAFTEEDDEKQN